jgi:hypothetical protein
MKKQGAKRIWKEEKLKSRKDKGEDKKEGYN